MSEKTYIEYIKIPPESNIVIGKTKLDPSIPLPVIRTDKDKENGDVDFSSIKAGVISVLSHYGSDKEGFVHQYFDYYKSIVLGEDNAVFNLLTAAKVRIEKKDYDNAETLLKALSVISPHEEVFILLSSVYAFKANEVKDSDSDKYEAYDTLILETLKAGHTLFKKSDAIIYELASFHYREGNFSKAIEYLDEFISTYKNEDARLSNAKKMKEKATEALDKEDEYAEVYDLIMTNRYDEGVKKALALYEKYDKEYQYALLYGWALRVSGHFKEAKDVLLLCLKSDNTDALFYNELAMAEWEVGSKELAKEYMKTAEDLDKDNASYSSNLALMSLYTKDYESAERALYSLIERDDNDPMIEMLIKEYNASSGTEFVPPENFVKKHENSGEDDHHPTCGHDHHSHEGDESEHSCECEHDHHHSHDHHHGHECACGHHHMTESSDCCSGDEHIDED